MRAFEQALRQFNRHDFGGAKSAFEGLLSKFSDQAEIVARVRTYLANVTAEQLQSPRLGDDEAGYPPPSGHTVLACLHVVMDEEWNHHRYACRDLDALTR